MAIGSTDPEIAEQRLVDISPDTAAVVVVVRGDDDCTLRIRNLEKENRKLQRVIRSAVVLLCSLATVLLFLGCIVFVPQASIVSSNASRSRSSSDSAGATRLAFHNPKQVVLLRGNNNGDDNHNIEFRIEGMYEYARNFQTPHSERNGDESSSPQSPSRVVLLLEGGRPFDDDDDHSSTHNGLSTATIEAALDRLRQQASYFPTNDKGGDGDEHERETNQQPAHRRLLLRRIKQDGCGGDPITAAVAATAPSETSNGKDDESESDQNSYDYDNSGGVHIGAWLPWNDYYP